MTCRRAVVLFFAATAVSCRGASIEVRLNPGPPSTVSASSGVGEITVTWSPVERATGYAVLVSGTGALPVPSRIDALAPPLTIPGFTTTADVTFTVVTLAGDSESDPSFPVKASPIDPAPLGPEAWSAEGESAGGAAAGVTPIGDFSGDGFDDIAVGGVGLGANGAVRIYFGEESGLGDGYTQLNGIQGGGNFGHSISAPGDVDGDGFDDLLIGAYLEDVGLTNDGATRVYHGGPGGLITVYGGVATTDEFGIHLGSAGDVDENGEVDFVVSAWHADFGETDEGVLYIFVNGVGSMLAQGNEAGAELGRASGGSVGDVDGDGRIDVGVGLQGFNAGGTDRGMVKVLYGIPGGFGPAPWTSVGVQDDEQLGATVEGAGDVNADGFDDVVASAPGLGNLHLYLGSATGLPATPSRIVSETQGGSGFAIGVSAAGDVNGDGFDDVVVGSPLFDGTAGADSGHAELFLGSSGGLSASSSWSVDGNRAGEEFGLFVSGAGDVNADGLDDVLVGAPLDSNPQALEGSAHLFLGLAHESPVASVGFALTGAVDTSIRPVGAFLSDIARKHYTCSWDFGDDTAPVVEPCFAGALDGPEHAYSKAGTFPLRLRVAVDDSRSAESVTTVRVAP